MAEFDFPALMQFMKHADDEQLTLSEYLDTSGFPDSYNGLKVKVGFGKGNKAKVPWVAFIGFGQKVTDGIYPVLLYYREQKILVLAYGLSSWNAASTEWKFSQTPPTIKQYFKDNKLAIPKNYKDSYVFKPYKVDPTADDYSLNSTVVFADLVNICSQFVDQLEGKPTPDNGDGIDEPQLNPEPVPELLKTFNSPIIKNFLLDSKAANYRVSEPLARRFIAALATKPFVILTGLSGSGKTKLAQVFARWISAAEEQYSLVPVGADWTNREPLLGYPNALDPAEYVFPESGVLKLIMEAAENPGVPYFLILDEMNMSHVERYFADFLSAMESDEPIPLHSRDITNLPKSIILPSNLFIIGTVNVDETTYMFSPKVLDRANVIEFRVSKEDMEDYLIESTHQKIDMNVGQGQAYSKAFMALRENNGSESSIREQLMLFFTELKKIGAEFGYRSAAEINRFYALMKKLDPLVTENEIMDCAILQKLLPKVHGSRGKLEKVLIKLIELSVENKDIIDALTKIKVEYTDSKVGAIYPQSLEKILRMYWGMLDNGFTSFTEA